MPEPIAFSAIVYALPRGILHRENPTYTHWQLHRGVLFTPPSEHLRRRYMRSTEGPCSIIIITSANKVEVT